MTENHAIGSLSAVELRDAIAAGTFTARQVTEYFLSVIKSEADLGAFITVHDDAALMRADALDATYASTGVVGPLHGLPVAFKDAVNVAGWSPHLVRSCSSTLSRRPVTIRCRSTPIPRGDPGCKPPFQNSLCHVIPIMLFQLRHGIRATQN